MDSARSKQRHGLPVLPLKIFGTDIEGGQIHPVDEILGRHFHKTDRKGTTVPVEMQSPAASGIEPFVESAGKCRAAALMPFRKPDKDVGIVEESPN